MMRSSSCSKPTVLRLMYAGEELLYDFDPSRLVRPRFGHMKDCARRSISCLLDLAEPEVRLQRNSSYLL